MAVPGSAPPKRKEIYNIIVDTDRAHTQLFFRNLLQLQMNNDRVSQGAECFLEHSLTYYFTVSLHLHFI